MRKHKDAPRTKGQSDRNIVDQINLNVTALAEHLAEYVSLLRSTQPGQPIGRGQRI